MLSARPWLSLFFALGVMLVGLSPSLAASAPDIVRLKDGSFVRGTIVERVEGDRVIIETVTGELRTISFGDISFAGPVDGAGTAPSAPPSSASTVPVRFTSALDKLIAYELTGSAHGMTWGYGWSGYTRVDAFRPLCMAPCTIEVPRGTYTFGIAVEDGTARRASGGPFNVDAETTFDLEYESREGYRITGWVLFAAAEVAALAVIASPLAADDIADVDYGPPLIIGTSLALGGLLTLPLIMFNDHLEVNEVGSGVRF